MIQRPSPAQLAWQRDALAVFIHFGVNTFTGREWGDGGEDPAVFAPTALDTDQWVRVARDAGARTVILTAKHHDGFCLWPTATTDHSVASSDWRDGAGDVVAELAASCRRFGLGLGLYLSPWDRNADCYDDPAAYDAFYTEQLRELCTGYGPLTEVWFDGAGSAGRSYDWDAIMAVVDAHQSGAMVFNMGRPTIRWVGNEDGLASDPVTYAVDGTRNDNYTDTVLSVGEPIYLPPECDVSIRPGWFWHPTEEPKSLEHLLAIHARSIGLGANLLINLPPDTRGLIPDADVARLGEWRAALDAAFGAPVAVALEDTPDGVLLTPAGPVDHLDLHERLEEGQRVTAHALAWAGGGLEAGTVGVLRRHLLGAEVAGSILLTGTCATDDGSTEPLRAAHLSGAVGHRTGRLVAPELPEGYEASTDAPLD